MNLSPPALLTDWLTLDVGGRSISTSRATLLVCQDSVLARMFSPHSSLEPAKLNKEGHYVLDCDPDIFSVILNWLRYDQVLLPTNMAPRTVAVVAEYFGLTPLVNLLVPPNPTSPTCSPPFPDIVPLDVRGRKFNVNRSFLTRYPNSYLAEMFSANSRYTPARLPVDGSYSIDADPECFSVILNFLQYDRVMLPTLGGPSTEDVRFVATQFGLGNEISLALQKAEDRLADTRARLVTLTRGGLREDQSQ